MDEGCLVAEVAGANSAIVACRKVSWILLARLTDALSVSTTPRTSPFWWKLRFVFTAA